MDEKVSKILNPLQTATGKEMFEALEKIMYMEFCNALDKKAIQDFYNNLSLQQYLILRNHIAESLRKHLKYQNNLAKTSWRKSQCHGIIVISDDEKIKEFEINLSYLKLEFLYLMKRTDCEH